jgi:hypothetical protein
LLGVILGNHVFKLGTTFLIALQALLQLPFSSVHSGFLIQALSGQSLNLAGELLGLVFQFRVLLMQFAIFFFQKSFLISRDFHLIRDLFESLLASVYALR